MADSSSTTTRTLKIVVDTSQAKDLKPIADGIAAINRNTRSTADSLGLFKSVFVTAFAALRVRDLANISDTMQQLFDRISVLSGGTEEAHKVFAKLAITAKETKSSIEATAQVYARVSAATEKLNLGTDRTIALTKLLQNSYRLSGASSEEAANATVQFTQALSLGVLRGQDFKSVLSQNVVLGNILAEGLKNGRGELQKMAEAGKLTNEYVLPKLFAAMDKTNDSAKKLGTTFGQVLTTSMNDFKLKVLELNQNVKGAEIFEGLVKTATENWKAFAIVLTAMATATIPLLISRINALVLSMAPLLLNPYVLAFAAIGAAIGYFAIQVTDTQKNYKKLNDELERDALGERLKYAKGSIAQSILLNDAEIESNKKVVTAIEARLETMDKLHANRLRDLLTSSKMKEDLEASKESRRPPPNYGTGEEKDPETRRAELIKKLNKAYSEGKITVGQYTIELDALDRQLAKNKFISGKEDLEKYNKEMRKFNLQEWTRDLNAGQISMEKFNAAVEQNELAQLNEDLAMGKISIDKFDESIVKVTSKFEGDSVLRSGMRDYIKSVGTFSQQMAGFVTNTFSTLEDSFVQMTKTGKLNFSEFAQAVLDDLNRIIIRATIIAPLAKGILNYIGPGESMQVEGASQGAPLKQFASGGVFDSPTGFSYGQGKMGVMGEAGPEAVVPLSRNSSGDLGIKATTAPVYVNIVNNSGGAVEQSESTGANGEKMLEILIHGKVKDGIATGKFDKSFQTAYGLNRRGV